MKPMVEARVSDETGHDERHLLQPAVAGAPLPPRHPAAADRASWRRRRVAASTSPSTPRPASQVATGEDMATYPASEGLTRVQIAALVHEHRDDHARRARAAARPHPRARAAPGPAAPRSPPPTSATRRAAAAGSRSTSSCCCRSRCCADARSAARARAPKRSQPPGDLTARWLARLAAVHAHRRPAQGDGGDRRGHRASDRPMQRLLMGEVGSGKTVVALYAMLRAVESGGQAALMAPTETLAEQHFATLQKLMPGELVQAALLTGSHARGPPHRPAGQARKRRAEAAGRHPRDHRGAGRVRPARGRRRRRAAPLRRQPAPRAGPQGAAPAWRRTSCT